VVQHSIPVHSVAVHLLLLSKQVNDDDDNDNNNNSNNNNKCNKDVETIVHPISEQSVNGKKSD
jgi:hypothetical protein